MGIISSEKAAASTWVMAAGIQRRQPLKPIYTGAGGAVEDERENEATTPTFEGSIIPSELSCPPAPRKPRAAAANKRCNKFCNGKMEFFVTPTDLEAVFIRRHVGY